MEIRELRSREWPGGAALCARALRDEPYMRVAFGEDDLVRFAAVHDFYAGFDPIDAGKLTLGAFTDGYLLAVGGASPPGACTYCGPLGDDILDDGFSQAFRRIDPAVRQVHAGLPPHWYVAPIAVEPVVQGAGLGRRVTDALAVAAWAREAAPMVLECGPHVRAFYEYTGYTYVADVSDDVISMGTMIRVVTP